MVFLCLPSSPSAGVASAPDTSSLSSFHHFEERERGGSFSSSLLLCGWGGVSEGLPLFLQSSFSLLLFSTGEKEKPATFTTATATTTTLASEVPPTLSTLTQWGEEEGGESEEEERWREEEEEEEEGPSGIKEKKEKKGKRVLQSKYDDICSFS